MRVQWKIEKLSIFIERVASRELVPRVKKEPGRQSQAVGGGGSPRAGRTREGDAATSRSGDCGAGARAVLETAEEMQSHQRCYRKHRYRGRMPRFPLLPAFHLAAVSLMG